MGKTRDLFKKIRDTKGTLHAKMASMKDRNAREVVEKREPFYHASGIVCWCSHCGKQYRGSSVN